MQDDIEMKLSMLFDNELDSKEALDLFEQMRGDENLQAKWNRYNLASFAVKGETSSSITTNFVEQVGQAIQLEPTILAPGRHSKTLFSNPVLATAIAASVFAFAVLSVNYFNSLEPLVPEPIAENSVPVAQQFVSQDSDEHLHPLDLPLDPLIDQYILTHNETSYSAGNPGMLPYARVISYRSPQ